MINWRSEGLSASSGGMRDSGAAASVLPSASKTSSSDDPDECELPEEWRLEAWADARRRLLGASGGSAAEASASAEPPPWGWGAVPGLTMDRRPRSPPGAGA